MFRSCFQGDGREQKEGTGLQPHCMFMADIPFFMQSQNITGVAEIKLKAEVKHESGPKFTECSCNNVALTFTSEAFYF